MPDMSKVATLAGAAALGVFITGLIFYHMNDIELVAQSRQGFKGIV